ncbi:hypothetical protein M9H77_26608 [Catharanthus roseus]|uniref:Uncharacterized protein n=1 Tax=Catharanthus roseus TaxID=4058 RepID=A0ACC0AC14_CATRO|nr:hypothetical protein M9H77_26608 [Catharanthus roseus]
MQGRNTVKEVLRLSAERGYTVFYRNGEHSNVLSDIVVAHPTTIAMLRTWPYVLIMDTTYKTNKDMESKMRDLTSLLQEISTGPISNVREVRKIGKSSGSSSGSGSGSGSGSNPSPRGRGRPPHSDRSRGRGRSSGRSNLSTVVSPDSPPVPFPFKNAFLGFMYQFIQNWKNVVGDVQELAGMAGTLVHDSVSKYEGASSHSASAKVFLKTYILLFSRRRTSRGWIGWAGIHCLKSNCLRTRSGMYGSTQSKYAMNLCHVET